MTEASQSAQHNQSHSSALFAGAEPYHAAEPNATPGCLPSLSAASETKMLVFLENNGLTPKMHIGSDSSGTDGDKGSCFLNHLIGNLYKKQLFHWLH